ncbi:cytochrome P450 [Streptomyces acidiscabies]|uniref:Cytochrome P450 n=1 Tax=Streptomyces acidiscabies TaxID=42234 RepID=A0A0L0KHK7_9ACTN|nr:cytochrome P450 [Streptomyces acidiscabies]KND37271.1 hypothetical protein IQ63_10125 [Streptomyces acidiscabies]
MAPPAHLTASPPADLVSHRTSDPYPYFRWLRHHAPAFAEHKASGLTVWHVSRYDDVHRLLGDRRLSKNPDLVPGYRPGPDGLNRHLVHCDPPEHTRLRHLVNGAFLPRRVSALEPYITDAARALLDRLVPEDGVDVIADFAAPLTFNLICTILGVPDHMNTPAVRAMLADTVVPGARPHSGAALRAFFQDLIAHKRRHTTAPSDLLGALVQAGGALTEEELTGTAYLLLLVGHDTTVNLIGNGILALLHHPQRLKELRGHPELLESGLEELLRYDSPVREATFRAATSPVELHGRTIRPGDIVSLLIGSANRDETRFPHPDSLDLSRDPNEHLAFGRGRHFCVGAALARLEGRVAFRLLLEHLGDVRLAVPAEDLRWRPSRVMRGLESLPVVRS